MDGRDPQRDRLAGYADLMRQIGLPVPDTLQQRLLPRTGPAPIEPVAMPQPPAPRPRWPGYDAAPLTGPGAARDGRTTRRFPVRNPPWGGA